MSKRNKIFKTLGFFIISIIVTIFFIIVFTSNGFFNDPGFLWHLRDGENIVKTFKIPYKDTFLSVTRPWISDQWLSDVILYVTYSLGNFPLIFYFITFLFIYFVLVFFARNVLCKYSNNFISVITSCYIILNLRCHYIARPVAFSFILMIIFIYLLEHYKKNISNSNDLIKLNFSFFILFLFWANLHPSFFMAFLVWGTFVVEMFIKHFFEYKKNKIEFITLKNLYKNYILSSLFICGATLINPYGILLHESILFLSNNQYFMNLNSEWKRMELFSTQGLLITAVIIFIIIYFTIKNAFRKKVGFAYFITSVIFYLYTMRHVRGVTYFSIISSIPLSVCLKDLLSKRISKKIFILRLFPKFYRQVVVYFRDNKIINVAIIFLILSIMLNSTSLLNSFKFNEKYSKNLKPSENVFPYKVRDYINHNHLRGNLVASPNFGGFLIWYVRGIKPVIDDRNTLLGEKMYKDYLSSVHNANKHYMYAKSHNAKYILIPRRSRSYKRFLKSGAFRVLFKKGQFILFEI